MNFSYTEVIKLRRSISSTYLLFKGKLGSEVRPKDHNQKESNILTNKYNQLGL